MTGYIWDWDASTEGNNVLVGSGSGVSLAEGWAPSTVNNAMRGLMGQVAGWKTLIEGSIAAGGTANAITVTSGLAHTAYAEPMLISFKASAANTGATTINVDSIGTKNIKLSDGRALPANSIVASGIFWVSYDAGDDVFYLLNPSTTLKMEFGYKNLLHNGGFQVAQRGAGPFTSTSSANNDDTYQLDGAILLSDGNDIVDVSQVADSDFESGYCITLDVETINKKFGILLPLESLVSKQAIHNGTVSLQFKAKTTGSSITAIRAAVLAWAGTADSITSDVVSAWEAEDTNPTLATSWTAENTAADLTVGNTIATFTIENIAVDTASVKQLAVFIYTDETATTLTDTLVIGDVQLEVGPVCTAYEHRPIGVDLDLCRRYYQQDDFPGIFYGFPNINGTGSTNLHWFWARDVVMRIDPSMDFTGVTLSTGTIGTTQTKKNCFFFRLNAAVTAGTSATASGTVTSTAEL